MRGLSQTKDDLASIAQRARDLRGTFDGDDALSGHTALVEMLEQLAAAVLDVVRHVTVIRDAQLEPRASDEEGGVR